MSVVVLNDNRVTASLHGATGTVMKTRLENRPGRFRWTTETMTMSWIQFDEPQRGAGSPMTGVWLENSMFEGIVR